MSYLYRCCIYFSYCPLEYSREILPPTSHQRSSSWQTSSGGCGQVFVLLRVGKTDVVIFKLGHNLFPVSHCSRCLGPAVLPSATWQASPRSDCQSLVLTSLCPWSALPAQQKWWQHALTEMKQRILHLSSLLTQSAAMTLHSRHCYWANQSFWVQQEWQDFGSPKARPPELSLLLDHNSPVWPLSFLSCLSHPSSRDTVSLLSSKRMSFFSMRSLHGTMAPIRPQNPLLSSSLWISSETANSIWSWLFCKK